MTRRPPQQSSDGTAAAGWSKLHHAVVDHLTEIGETAFAVFAVLLRLADASGFCYPSIAKLAQKTKMRPQRVRNAVNHLRDLGLVKVVSRRTPAGDFDSNGYIVSPGGVLPNGSVPPVKRDGTVLRNGTPRVLPNGTQYQEPVGQEPANKKRSSVCDDAASSAGGRDGDGFGAWWREYPRKVAKTAAAQAYQRAVKAIASDHTCQRAEAVAFLLDRVRAFAKSDKGRGDV